MITSHMKFVVSVAKKYLRSNLELEDLIQEGNLGLCEAISHFDTSRWYKFISLAVRYIQWRILTYVMKNRRLIGPSSTKEISRWHKLVKLYDDSIKKYWKEPTTEYLSQLYDCLYNEHVSPKDIQRWFDQDQNHLSLSEDDPGDPDAHKELEQELSMDSINTDITRTLNTLTQRERDIIKMTYGLDDGKEMTLDEIGEIVYLTRERVRQIKEKAIRKIRHTSRSRLLQKYLGE